LLHLLDGYRHVTVREFANASVAQFELFRRKQIRIGTNDLRIASIAVARNETLLTRNAKDFSKVPGLRFEDWTR
jgi:tRNA(fMet)-specific endonuclease VapC